MDIGRYTEKKWGAEQRNIYIKQLDNCFTQLSENPMLGISCEHISKDYQKLPQGSHLIFYKSKTEEIIEIIRILHKSMDVKLKL